MGAQHLMRTAEMPRVIPFDPLILSPAFWLKADAITGKVNGDPISSWPDSSGNSRPGTQATGTKQPLYRASGIGGLPAVDFDGADDALAVAWAAPTTDMVVFAVCESDVQTAGNRTLFAFNVTTAMEIRASTNSWNVLRNVTAIITTPLTAGQNVVMAGRRDSGNITIHKNAKTATATTTSTGNYVGASALVGGLASSSFFDGLISEIIGFSGTLTTADFNLMMNYLGKKYAITVAA